MKKNATAAVCVPKHVTKERSEWWTVRRSCFAMITITFEEREAAAYDEAAVEAHKARRAAAKTVKADKEDVPPESALVNWPVQIKLAPIQAPYFEDADLLIAADCSAYAYGNFHGDFIDGKITLMGCPKLDMVDYSEKLTELFTRNTIRSITLTRMEVPCCGGLEYAVKQAVAASGKDIPLKVVTIGINGDLK